MGPHRSVNVTKYNITYEQATVYHQKYATQLVIYMLTLQNFGIYYYAFFLDILFPTTVYTSRATEKL